MKPTFLHENSTKNSAKLICNKKKHEISLKCFFPPKKKNKKNKKKTRLKKTDRNRKNWRVPTPPTAHHLPAFLGCLLRDNDG